MKVAAKCLASAFETNSATRYDPGCGPLHDGLYEIERDGPLASLKLGGKYVFEFDREAPKAEVKAKPDYSNLVTKPLNPNRGKKRNGYKCKNPGCEVVCANPYLLKIHKKTHEVAVEQAA